MKLCAASKEIKLNDVYDYVKKFGNFHENDGILLLRIYGEAGDNDLLSHIEEVMELYNNPEDDTKTNEPITSYYVT